MHTQNTHVAENLFNFNHFDRQVLGMMKQR